ncbi:hypothetical protein [uncultured Tolumonas sp.]|uniref:hypothetical protein n=1 Tax=uncultured Tolumonas sp. TaxID=263765 RepID=UPI00292D2F96|nr:hypothetical protein [uncultured Tolumonas sp.]
MSFDNWIALIGAITGVISLFIALISYYTSNRAYKIAQETYEDQKKEISIYLIESLKWKRNEKSFVSFAVSFINKSTLQNSISDIRLIIKLKNTSKSYPELYLPLCNEQPKSGNYKSLGCPLMFNSKETISGWVNFELPHEIIKETTIEKFIVEAETASGFTTNVKTGLVSYVIE